jgi:hypothetical protein
LPPPSPDVRTRNSHQAICRSLKGDGQGRSRGIVPQRDGLAVSTRLDRDPGSNAMQIVGDSDARRFRDGLEGLRLRTGIGIGTDGAIYVNKRRFQGLVDVSLGRCMLRKSRWRKTSTPRVSLLVCIVSSLDWPFCGPCGQI